MLKEERDQDLRTENVTQRTVSGIREERAMEITGTIAEFTRIAFDCFMEKKRQIIPENHGEQDAQL